MEYNTARQDLKIPEYGRAIQQMVDHCKTLNDKQDRQDFAEVIIDKLGILNPHLRDIPDFQHKLWDHLFIMAEFDLEVDSPFPIPTREAHASKPNTMNYPRNLDDFRYYGNIIRDMIAEIKDWENDNKKMGISIAIANQMKKSYLTWNKDQVDDIYIIKHLEQLSDGKIILPQDTKLLESLDKAKGITVNNHKNNKKKNNRKTNFKQRP